MTLNNDCTLNTLNTRAGWISHYINSDYFRRENGFQRKILVVHTILDVIVILNFGIILNIESRGNTLKDLRAKTPFWKNIIYIYI